MLDHKNLTKSLTLKLQDTNEDEMKKINQYTLEQLSAEQVYAFKTVVGDNGLDDRNFMPFTLSALKDLEKLYPGKPVIKNHSSGNVDGMVARIYDTELITDTTKTAEDGSPLTSLVAKCYMANTPENAGLIAEIKAGIKKEVSTGFSCSSLICSICGKDAVSDICKHFPGRTYKTADGQEKLCTFAIDGVKEAYELSFVTVPAQPRAGTVKTAQEPEEDAPETDISDADKLRLELEALDL